MAYIKFDFLPQLPEEKLRNSFVGYVDYLLYCFSLTGSLANLTRFPYLAYSHNGCKTFIILWVYLTRVRVKVTGNTNISTYHRFIKIE